MIKQLLLPLLLCINVSAAPAYSPAQFRSVNSSTSFEPFVLSCAIICTFFLGSVLSSVLTKDECSYEQRQYLHLTEKYTHLLSLVEHKNNNEFEQYILEKYVGYKNVFKEFAQELQDDYNSVESELQDNEAQYFKSQKHSMSQECHQRHLDSLKHSQELLSKIKTVWVYFYKNFYRKNNSCIVPCLEDMSTVTV